MNTGLTLAEAIVIATIIVCWTVYVIARGIIEK
jgi:hypothetical protein